MKRNSCETGYFFHKITMNKITYICLFSGFFGLGFFVPTLQGIEYIYINTFQTYLDLYEDYRNYHIKLH